MSGVIFFELVPFGGENDGSALEQKWGNVSSMQYNAAVSPLTTVQSLLQKLKRGATENSGLIFSFHLRWPRCEQNADLAKLESIQNQLCAITKSSNPWECRSEIKTDILCFAIYGIPRMPPLDVSHTDRDPISLVVLWGIQQTSELLLLTAGEVVVFLFPRRQRGNWDIIQTKSLLTGASVSVYVGEVRVSIPFRLTSVIYSLPTIGSGYFDESHEDRTNIQYIDTVCRGVRGKGGKQHCIMSHSFRYVWFNSSAATCQSVRWGRLKWINHFLSSIIWGECNVTRKNESCSVPVGCLYKHVHDLF